MLDIPDLEKLLLQERLKSTYVKFLFKSQKFQSSFLRFLVTLNGLNIAKPIMWGTCQAVFYPGMKFML